MNKFINFKIETFVLAIFCFYFFPYNKHLFLLIFITLIIIMFFKQQKITDFLLNISLAMLFNFIYVKFNKLDFLPFNSLFDSLIGFSIRNTIINHVENNFSENSSNFIKLIIFNIKDESIKEFYNKLNELSISHLVVVSGFHLSIIPTILSKFIKSKFFEAPINLTFMIFLNYLTSFSIGSFRALLFYIFSLSKHTKQFTFPLSTLTTMLISPLSVLTNSFLMSYTATYAIKISKINLLKSNWKKIIITSLACTFFLLPFIGNFSGKISIFFPLYSFIFTPIILFIYLLTLIFFWIPYYDFLLKYIVIAIFDLVNLLSSFNVFLPTLTNNIYFSFTYWILLFFIFEKDMLIVIIIWFKNYLFKNVYV